MKNVILGALVLLAMMSVHVNDVYAQPRPCGNFIKNGTMYVSTSPESECSSFPSWGPRSREHGTTNGAGPVGAPPRAYYRTNPNAPLNNPYVVRRERVPVPMRASPHVQPDRVGGPVGGGAPLPPPSYFTGGAAAVGAASAVAVSGSRPVGGSAGPAAPVSGSADQCPRVTDAQPVPNRSCQPGHLQLSWRGQNNFCMGPKPSPNAYLCENKATGRLAWFSP